MILEVVIGIILSVVLFYGIAHLLEEKGKSEGEKTEPFSAGEVLPKATQKYRSKIGHHVLLFLLFDSLAFVLIFARGRLSSLIYLISLTLIAWVIISAS